MTLAYQAFRLTLANNNDHAEAYNNLGVLELRKGHVEMVSDRCSIQYYNTMINPDCVLFSETLMNTSI